MAITSLNQGPYNLILILQMLIRMVAQLSEEGDIPIQMVHQEHRLKQSLSIIEDILENQISLNQGPYSLILII